MAQETAGTIGIPVLKNEVLPYLTDYAKRRERAELYKQKAQQRAAELAAKKAAEDAKYIPKFDAATGADMWEHVLKPENEKDIQAGLELAKDQNVPRYQVGTYVNEMNRRQTQKADISKQIKEGVLKTADDLSKTKFVKITPDYGYKWAKTKNALTGPEVFAQEALADPNIIDFDAIGKFGKDYKVADYTYRDKGGNTKVVKMSPLFDYKYKKDPILGTEVPEVVGVNGLEAQKLIESNPDLQNAFKVWVGNRAKEYQSTRTFIDPNTGSPTMIRPELAQDQAAKEFMEQSFGKYGKIEYGKEFAMPTKESDKEKETTQIVETPITATVYQKVANPKKGQPTQRVVDVNLGVGTNVTLPKKSRVQVGANRKVYPIGGDIKKAVDAGILKSSGLNDGSYILNYGFDVQTYQKPKAVYRLTKDHDFYQKDGSTITYKAGTILDVNKVNLLNKAGATNAYTQIQKPIRISPGMFQWSENLRTGEDQIKMPILRNLDLIISESEIPDLKSAEEAGRKAKPSGGPLSSW